MSKASLAVELSTVSVVRYAVCDTRVQTERDFRKEANRFFLGGGGQNPCNVLQLQNIMIKMLAEGQIV